MTDTQAITLSDFITKHNLHFECHRVDSRPDGLMQDNEGMRHWRCRIITPRQHAEDCNVSRGFSRGEICCCHPVERSFGLYFSQGSAHTEAPTLADVLDCLASDASGYEQSKWAYGNEAAFRTWAQDYGYDVDSRKAEKTFKAIKRQAQQLKRVIGTEAYEELLWNTERL